MKTDDNLLDEALNHSIQGEFEKSQAKLVCVNEEDPRAIFNLGWHDLRHGSLKDGMLKMAVGRYLNAFGSPALGGPIPRPEDDIQGKHVLLRSEGGFGDEIANFRFAQGLKDRGAIVTVSCSGGLAPLFAKEGFPAVTTATAEANGVYFDYWVPAMSAICCLELEYEDLDGSPYLTKPVVEKSDKFRIGLKWSGNPEFEHQQHRVFPHDLMFDAVKGHDVEYVSLQRDEGKDLKPDWVSEVCLDQWTDTAAEIAKCDLVITSCTSIAHCAGAMGIPTWVVVPILPYYIWALPTDTSPWYDSVKLYRQENYGDWTHPFDRIKTELKEVINNGNN